MRVRAGTGSLDLAPEGVRHIAFAGREVVSSLYAAARAADWSTYLFSPVVQEIQVDPQGLLLVREEIVEGLLSSRLRLHFADAGSLTALLELTALSDVDLNRWGFNICLEAGEWGGASVLEHSGASLPNEIAPQPVVDGVIHGLFPPTPTLALRHRDGMTLRLGSEGLPLEMEDQRNWTDSTFKVYSGSLQAPRPIRLAPGTTLRQELTITVSNVPKPLAVVGAAPVAVGPPVELPRVGVQLNDPLPSGAAPIEELLRKLGVDHVRIDQDGPEPPEVTRLPDVPVELAVLVDELDGRTLRHVAAVAGRLPRESRVLLHQTARRTTGIEAAEALSTLLAGTRNDILIVPGSDAYFVDLNRDRPKCAGSVSFSITPTVHASDTESIFSTLPVQCQAVRQARQILAADVVVSPVTLRLRGNPEWREAAPDARRQLGPQHLDARLHRLEGAAWTMGSVHALTLAEAASGTWHELGGPRGLVHARGEAVEVSPAFHALSALQARERPVIRAVTTADGGVTGLMFPARAELLLVSQRPWIQRLPLRGWGPELLDRRRLRGEDLPAAVRTSHWWDQSAEPLDSPEAITLEPFEITRLTTGRGS